MCQRYSHSAEDLLPKGTVVKMFVNVQLQGSFVVFWLVYLITLSIGIVLAYLVATISPNLDVANAALPAFVVCYMLANYLTPAFNNKLRFLFRITFLCC
jgi:hypothetical protein